MEEATAKRPKKKPTKAQWKTLTGHLQASFVRPCRMQGFWSADTSDLEHHAPPKALGALGLHTTETYKHQHELGMVVA